MYERELSRFAVRHQIGVLRCLFAALPRLVTELQAAQPFDIHVALEAG